ncbi:ABC transporter ATP-binding protein [Ruminococcus sp. OA3]|uniref:ABC transporter ATP-binding protein n=1 Tax=Ruminococcus sp. OA3 TaxID=2914164 RepID=UPI001F06A76F|nr:ABC transporter ATP-binding protein [Ruminococcus sp. OA3]MCH1982532.1 ABC transporter ATP-binding protein [Ruminococcus sp. OA3]
MKLEILGLSKSYGKKNALSRVNLELTPGVYGLLGPNGAGKSTLMNIIAGNLAPDTGRVLYNNIDVTGGSATFRKVLGFMPQQQALYDQFTGYRFLAYMADLKGMPKRQAIKEIKEVLKFVNMTEQAKKRMASYSGGMKQRILIAQAVLNQPAVLILDEPTAGLDPRERIRVRNMISQIAEDKIVLLATHVVSDIEQIGKNVILMKQGNVLAAARPQKLIEELAGKVYDLVVPASALTGLERQYLISNVSYCGEQLMVHVIADRVPVEYPWQRSHPTLEDVYLYRFEDEVRRDADMEK